MKISYKNELEIMETAITEAYRRQFNTDIASSDKSQFDIVTDVDFGIEKELIATISRHFPNDKILSEETNYDTVIENRTWTIDPIDGTYNMSRSIPLYGIQCALYDNDEIVLSLIYLPLFNEMYSALKCEGAYVNGKRLSSRKRSLAHSVVSFGDFPHKRPDDFRDEFAIMKKLSQKIAKIRMFGSACIDLAYVGAGKTDGTIIFTKNRWDIDPGILIASEAGAKIKSLTGDYERESRVVIATATDDLYAAIVEALH